MARYEHLPIYKKAMDLSIYFEKIVRNFSRYNKYTIGSELRTMSRDIVRLIIKANTVRNKLPVLYELRERLEELKVLIRIAKEAQAFKGFKSFHHAIVYLNELDQFVKHRLKGKYYLRYCDDFVMLSGERDELLKWKAEVERFLAYRLKLRLNKKRQSLQPVSNGVNFLGYIVRRNYILVRRRVVNNLKSRLSDFERKLIIKDHSSYVKIIYDYPLLEKLRATLASYFGHFKWADSYRLRTSLMERYGFLKRFFSLKDGMIKENYRVPRSIPSIRLQYRYFKTRFSEDVLLFQVGSHYEFFEDESEIARMLGLKKIHKPSARNPKYGFPVRYEKAFVNRIKDCGRSVTIVGETDRYLTRIKERLPKYSLLFQQI